MKSVETLVAEVAETQCAVTASEADMAVYLWLLALAQAHGWKLRPEDAGRELLRRLGRVVLATVVAPSLWASCRSCAATGCVACGGSGSVAMTREEFKVFVGSVQFETVWAPRLAMVAAIIHSWVGGKRVVEQW